LAAIKYLQNTPGDIILIAIASEKTSNKYPLEAEPLIYFLFQITTQLDLIVIESAGNSEKDISEKPKIAVAIADKETNLVRKYLEELCAINPLYVGVLESFETFANIPQTFYNNFWTHSSGAILVGAAIDIGCNDGWNKLEGSNYSTGKVEVYATVGHSSKNENVETLDFDYDNPIDKSKITTKFSFTSAAAAVIAGVAVSIQATAKKEGKLITPQKMLELLKKGNSVVNIKSGDKSSIAIGIIPDLKQIEKLI
jgi:hypothetical protein